MYTGSNPSALRSMELIDGALLRLLDQKSFEKISVKELCLCADVSRQTFYQLFDSAEEVIEYHFSKLFAEFEGECDNFGGATVGDIVYCFYDFFYARRAFVFILVHNNLTYLLQAQFAKYLQKIELFNAVSGKDAHADYNASFLAGALTGILIHWFQSSFDLSVAQLSEITVNNLTAQPLFKNSD